MSKYTVDLDEEQVEAIVIKELKYHYGIFAPECRPSYGIYSSDEKEDLKEMCKMRKALKRVLKYYGEEV